MSARGKKQVPEKQQQQQKKTLTVPAKPRKQLTPHQKNKKHWEEMLKGFKNGKVGHVFARKHIETMIRRAAAEASLRYDDIRFEKGSISQIQLYLEELFFNVSLAAAHDADLRDITTLTPGVYMHAVEQHRRNKSAPVSEDFRFKWVATMSKTMAKSHQRNVDREARKATAASGEADGGDNVNEGEASESRDGLVED